MTVKSDAARVEQLCKQYMSREVGQFTDSGSKAGLEAHALLGAQLGATFDPKAVLAARRAGGSGGDTDTSTIDYWIKLGQAELVKTGTESIRCNDSAALATGLLTSSQGTAYDFQIISQDDPAHHGHWFVVVNNTLDPVGYPDRFSPDSYVVDIWGCIAAEKASPVAYPAKCFFDTGDGNELKIVAGGTGGYAGAGAAPDAGRGNKKCYLTTAACGAMGLPDDCRDLEVLRWYRDTVLRCSASGRRSIEEYYATAPRIVRSIERRPDAAEIFQSLYVDVVHPAARAIEAKAFDEAFRVYREGYRRLRRLV